MQRLETLRKKIEKTDMTIIKNLAERQELVRQIGLLKIKRGMKTVDLDREKRLFEFYNDLSEEYHLQKTFINELFKAIINYSRKIEKD